MTGPNLLPRHIVADYRDSLDARKDTLVWTAGPDDDDMEDMQAGGTKSESVQPPGKRESV
jgi:hypothetical protein